MDRNEFSRELRYQLVSLVATALGFFTLGQLYEAAFDPKPIVVKLELPIAVDPDAIEGGTSIYRASMPPKPGTVRR